MQSIFSPAARREGVGEHTERNRRDGGLKMDWAEPLPTAWPMGIGCWLDLGRGSDVREVMRACMVCGIGGACGDR